MNKRITSILFGFVMGCAVVANAMPVFAAGPCSHADKNPVPAQESTCTVKGWEEHQLCADCGAPFDMNGNLLEDIPYKPLKEHTPDREEATETEPIKCTVCGYVLTPATGHLCINHLEEVPEVPATCTTTGTEAHFKCTDPACGKLYWDDDAHDEITDPSELVIDALDHAWADTWSKDEHNHWHACSRCDAKADEAAHTPDHPDGATFEYPVLCVECGYEMEAQREEGTIRVELPFKLTVKKTGELDPGKEIFKFMAEEFGAPVEYELITSTLETNGVKTYEGIFIFTIMEGDAGNLSEGFIFRQVKGDAEGWTYDETKFYAVPTFSDDRDTWTFHPLNEEGWPDYETTLNEIAFTNSYNASNPIPPYVPPKPEKPTEPEEIIEPEVPLAPETPIEPSVPTEPPVPEIPEEIKQPPQTGDNSNSAFWISILLVSGSVAAGTAIVGKKRKSKER